MSLDALPPEFLHRLAGVYRIEQEKQIGRLALRRGLITRDQFERSLRELEAGGPGRPLGACYLAWLTAPVIERLKAEAGADDAAPPGMPAIPGEVRAAAEAPENLVAEFVLVSLLGRGGAGEVWRAWDRQLGRWVAIKFPRLAAKAALLAQRFLREAHAVARLSHPGIIPIYRVDTIGDRPFIVMQHIDGTSLDEQGLSLTDSLKAMRDVALAVAYAHHQGVVHRDIKPGNIMIDAKGAPWLLDFGLAHIDEDKSLTASGLVLGTPQYMSPEQARGLPSAREASTDVYSLGATLYFLVTGEPPFLGTTFAEMVRKVAFEEPVPPKIRRPGIPKDVSTLVLKAMEKDPARRYATAADLAADIGRYLAGEPIHARSVSGLERVWRKGLRHRGVVIGAIVLLGVAAWAVGAVQRSKVSDEESRKSLAAKAEEMRKLELVAAARGHLDRARPAVERALQIYYHKSANFELAREAVSEAAKEIDVAIKKAPGLAEGHYWAGLSAKFLDSKPRAEECFRKALACDATHGMAHYELGRLLTERSLYLTMQRERQSARSPEIGRLAQEGKVEFELALKHQPDLIGQVEGVLAMFIRERSATEKGGVFQELRELVENPKLQGKPGMEQLFLLLAFDVAKEEQVQLVEKALDLCPHYVMGLIVRGGFRAQVGDFDGALADYDHALEIEAGCTTALVQRVLTNDRKNDHEAAVSDCNRLIALEGGNYDYHELRGEQWAALGKLPEAVADYRRSVELEPAQASTWQRLGAILTAMGDREGAMQAVTRSLELDPRLVLGWNSRALLKAALYDDWEGAIADERKAVEIDPKFAEGYVNIGKMSGHLGRYREAVEALEKAAAVAEGAWPFRKRCGELIEEYRRAMGR